MSPPVSQSAATLGACLPVSKTAVGAPGAAMPTEPTWDSAASRVLHWGRGAAEAPRAKPGPKAPAVPTSPPHSRRGSPELQIKLCGPLRLCSQVRVPRSLEPCKSGPKSGSHLSGPQASLSQQAAWPSPLWGEKTEGHLEKISHCRLGCPV